MNSLRKMADRKGQLLRPSFSLGRTITKQFQLCAGFVRDAMFYGCRKVCVVNR